MSPTPPVDAPDRAVAPTIRRGQIPAMILAYLPALLGLVVQIGLLGLVVKQWSAISQAEAIRDREAIKDATKRLEEAVEAVSTVKDSLEAEQLRIGQERLKNTSDTITSAKVSMDGAIDRLDQVVKELRKSLGGSRAISPFDFSSDFQSPGSSSTREKGPPPITPPASSNAKPVTEPAPVDYVPKEPRR